MTTTHIFIVDINTFRYHLEYLFAGTGARDYKIDFNDKENTRLTPQRENILLGMIADSQRVRKGDFVIFYLQQNYSKKVFEGRFYGIFKVKEEPSFLDNNDENQFLKRELQKSLTFRTIIESYEVYSKGISEWEALDEIKNIQSPNQMLWSLIYRKLKANRGNTMITIHESERLFKLIKDKNKKKQLMGENFSFDPETQEIIKNPKKNVYSGRKEKINVLPRLVKKYSENKSFETHLQAYIIQNIGKKINPLLDNLLIGDLNLEWLGNEVSCGVGMQRIDIMLSLKKDTSRIIVPIELKSIEAKPENIFQIQRYIDWLEQYYIPNRIGKIQPVLISKKIENKETDHYKSIIQGFIDFNTKNKTCLKLKHVEYELKNSGLIFEEINY